jgi:hypothetical protein
MELNNGKFVAPVSRNVERLAATISVNPPLPKEATSFMIPLPTIPPYASFDLANVRHW